MSEQDLLAEINDQIKVAMKAREKEKLQALRYLKSMLMENSTSKKPASQMDVIVKHHKKLKEALESYPEDHQMHIQTKSELKIVGTFLPKQLSTDEVQNIIENIKANLDKPNMGAIMKELQPQIKGRFDGKKASDMVKSSLN